MLRVFDINKFQRFHTKLIFFEERGLFQIRSSLTLSAAMTGYNSVAPIQLFLTTQSFYQMLGIDPPQLNQNWSPKWTSLYVLTPITLMWISTSAFCTYRAKTLLEFAPSVFVSLTELTCLMYYFVHIQRIETILQQIHGYEVFIQTSKYRNK